MAVSFLRKLVAGGLLWHAEGLVTSGSAAVPPNGVIFLTKFCFDYKKEEHGVAGVFNVTVVAVDSGVTKAKTLTDGLHLVLFDDQAVSYPEASEAWSKLPCAEKLKHARRDMPLPANFADLSGGFHTKILVNEHLRPRWWFVAIADCSGQPITVAYNVHMWNLLRGWQQEFSMDHSGVYYVSVVFLVVFLFQFVFQAWATRRSHSEEERYPLTLLVLWSTLFSQFSMLCFALHWHFFAKDGRGSFVLHLGGQFTRTCARFISMAILMLIAQGNFISRGLTSLVIYKTVGLLGPLAVLSFGLEAWADMATSRTYTTDFVYDLPLGRVLLFMNLTLVCLYARHVNYSFNRELNPQKREFYRMYGTAYGFWFLAMPITVIISMSVAPWVRYRVDLVNSCLAQACLNLSFIIGLWPDRQDSHLQRVMDTELATVPGARHSSVDADGKTDVNTPHRGGQHWTRLPDQ
eukprot:TRINITY_DN67312_c0_g1_i1.p1 TRINITY_DN67312_c0_g1~~TRINITY_DN67312_c0_g1_i1.p1  ORF type:complete len:483 (-),score=68.38 TRINITY_DN67312_c0_g1_i1:328-1713(-)